MEIELLTGWNCRVRKHISNVPANQNLFLVYQYQYSIDISVVVDIDPIFGGDLLFCV